MREVYVGKKITLENQTFEADEFYEVKDSLALIIVSVGCGVYADDETQETKGDNYV